MANRAIPFIQSQADGTFKVVDEGRQILEGITGKVVIVCVAGPYRTGKSFLLNKLIGAKQGFQVSGNVNACTKGIWLWGEPLVHNGATYLFLDSEGLGSIEQSQTFDVKIFSLALLLSSFFILNTQGTINEQALEQLELVVQCSQHIRVSDDGQDDVGQHFPAFLWVLRDFILDLQDEQGQSITSKQYLEQCLQPQKGVRGKVLEKNRIRQEVKNVLRTRDCVTLVRPVMDEKKLQNLNQAKWETLRPEFREQMHALKAKVMNEATPKSIDGALVNGSALLGLAHAYVEAINGGGVPTIHTAWQSVVEVQSRDALELAQKLFAKAIKKASKQVQETEALKTYHADMREECMAALRAKLVGNEEQRRGSEEELTKRMIEMGAEAARLNELRSRELCSSMLQALWDKGGLDGRISTGAFDSLAEWEAAKQSFIELYNAKAKGPSREVEARDFCERIQTRLLGSVCVRSSTRLAELNAAQEKLKLELEQRAHLQKKYEAVQAEQAAARQAWAAEAAAYKKAEGAAQRKLQEATAGGHAMELKLQEASSAQSQLRKEIERVAAKNKDLATKVARLKEQIKEGKSLAATQTQEMHAQTLNLQAQQSKIQELMTREKALQKASKDQEASTTQQMEAVNGKLQAKRETIKELKHQVQELQQAVEQGNKTLVKARKAAAKELESVLLEREETEQQTRKRNEKGIKEAERALASVQTELASLQAQSKATAKAAAAQAKTREQEKVQLETLLAKARQQSKAKATEHKEEKAQLEGLLQTAREQRKAKATEHKEEKAQLEGLLQTAREQRKEAQNEAQAHLQQELDDALAAVAANQKAAQKQQARADDAVAADAANKKAAKKQAKVHKRAAEKLQGEVDTLTQSVSQLTASLQTAQQSLEASNEQGVISEQQREGEWKQMEKARKAEIKTLTRERDSLAKKIVALEGKGTAMERELEEMEEMMSRQQKEAKGNQGKASKAAVRALQAEVEALQAALESERSERAELMSNFKEQLARGEASEAEVSRKAKKKKKKARISLEAPSIRVFEADPSEFQAKATKPKATALRTAPVSDEPSSKRSKKDRHSTAVPTEAAEEIPEQEDDDEEEDDEEARLAAHRANIELRRKRQSILPPPKAELDNPSKCTVQQLKAWLTRMNVELPGSREKKQYYVELVYKNEPLLQGQSPPTKSKKRKR